MLKLYRVVLPALVYASVLSGCAGGNSTSLPTSSAPSAAGRLVQAGPQAGTQSLLFPSDSEDQGATSPTVLRIFVADFNGGGLGNLKAFSRNGIFRFEAPGGLDGPQNIVSDSHGNVFVANFGCDCITSFTSLLQPYKANIALTSSPVGLALGPTGKLYTTLYPSGTLVTYNQSGRQVSPTINGPGNVTYVAVDSAGKIYITNSATNTLTTYKPNGTPTTPTITAGLNGPGPVVVDAAGKIYVANSGGAGSVTTYEPNGTQTTPTIPVNAPHGLSVATNGTIYVTDSKDAVVDTFKADGTPTTPTITGFSAPTGVTVLNR